MDQTPTPFLSIVIPVFNRAETLPKTLDTIRSQSLTNWECILVDDFSKDHAPEVCARYAEEDDRFIFLKNTRKKGAPGARNTGILAARSSWVLLFDSDNFLRPNALSKWAEALEENTSDVLVCYARVVNSDGEQIGKFHWDCEGDISNDLVDGTCYVDNNLAFIRTKLLKEIGLTDENCPSYQEWDTHLRLSKIARYHTLPLELVDYLRNTDDGISSNPALSAEGYDYVILKHLERFKSRDHALSHHVNEMLRALDTPDGQDLKWQYEDRWKEILPGFQYEPVETLATPTLFQRIANKLSRIFTAKPYSS